MFRMLHPNGRYSRGRETGIELSWRKLDAEAWACLRVDGRWSRVCRTVRRTRRGDIEVRVSERKREEGRGKRGAAQKSSPVSHSNDKLPEI